MKLKSLFVVVLATFLLPALVLAATPAMKEGLWEMTTTTVMPGMPFQIPPITMNHCYTKEELKDQNYAPKQDDNCKMTESKYSGNKYTWKVVCTGKSKGTGDGEITFKDTSSYEGKMTFNSEGTKMTSRYKAKRIGDCQ